MARSTGGGKGRVAKGVGYVFFTLIVYVLCVLWLLPYPEISRALEVRARGEGVALQIEDLGPSIPPGLKARRVRVSTPTAPELAVTLEEPHIGLPLVELVRGAKVFDFDASTLGGRISARYRLGERPTVRAQWEGLLLDRLPKADAWAELPLSGTVAGTLEAELDPANPERVSGKIDADLEQIKVGAGKARGFPVPELNLGKGRLKVSAQAGKVEIEAAEVEGGDLGIDFKGNILLRQDMQRSLINGVLSLQPSEKTAEDLALLFAVFPGTRSSDGRYTGRVRGSLGAPMVYKR